MSQEPEDICRFWVGPADPYYLMVGSNVDKKTFPQRFISPVNWTIWNACTIMTMAIEEKFINWMAKNEQKFHGQIWLE